MEVRNLTGAELVDDFLNCFEFFRENFCLEGAGGQRLNG